MGRTSERGYRAVQAPQSVHTAAADHLKRIRQLLLPEEISLLARVLYDRETQHEIAESDGATRSTVQSRIRTAVKKLANVGIDVVTPGRGRRQVQPDIVFCSDVLEGLSVTESPDGQKRGRWIRSPKTAGGKP